MICDSSHGGVFAMGMETYVIQDNKKTILKDEITKLTCGKRREGGDLTG